MERFANRDVAELTILDYATKKPFMYVDFANVSSVELTGETVYAYGGHGHVKRVAFSGEREGTLTLETQIATFKLYQLVTGGQISTGAKYVAREEIVASTEGSLTLTDAPVGASVDLYTFADDCGTAIEATVSDKTVSASSITSGTKYVVYYVKQVSSGVQTITIGADDFPSDVTITGLTYMRTESGKNAAYRMVAYKAQAQSNMNVEFSNTGDPGTLTITFDLMADSENDDKILDLIMED